MTKIIISILIIGAVGAGGYAIAKSHKGMPSSQEAGTSVAVKSDETPTGKKIPFSQFIKQAGSYKCTVNQHISGTDTVGTTYMDDGMIRGDYATSVQGMKITSSFVLRDGYSYSWNSMMPSMGFKSKASATTNTPEAPASGSYSFNADQVGDYDCQAWAPDQSKFTLPSGITWKEMGA